MDTRVHAREVVAGLGRCPAFSYSKNRLTSKCNREIIFVSKAVMAQPYGNKMSICTGILKEMRWGKGKRRSNRKGQTGEMATSRKAECNQLLSACCQPF